MFYLRTEKSIYRLHKFVFTSICFLFKKKKKKKKKKHILTGKLSVAQVLFFWLVKRIQGLQL